jgi:ABC-2 type transport system permease protein
VTRRKRLRFQNRVLVLVLLAVVPGWAGTVVLLYLSSATPALRWTIIGFLTFFVLGVFWFSGILADYLPGTVANVLNFMSFESRMEGFMRGLIDTRDVVFFLSVTCVALVIAFRALERRKWA